MKNTKLFLLVIIIGNFVFSQSTNELLNYYSQLKSSGLSDSQIETLAKERGYDLTKLDVITNSKNDNNLSSQTNTPNKSLQTNYNIYPVNEIDAGKTVPDLPVFGSQYFKNLSFDFSPQINLATPKNYQLGPGDGISISLWGASETNYRLELDREGKIHVPDIGPIFLSGLTILSAKSKIESQLSKIYNGLKSSIEQEKVYLDISLTSSRSVFVNIVGLVSSPGLYTLNGLSSIVHALYACGGISENGSYRTIEIIRDSKVLTIIDLYEYFLEGKMKQFFLKDQDIIRVPYYKSRVQLTGAVKFQGYFELLENQTLGDLLEYGGGLTDNGFKGEYLLSSVEGASYSTKKISSPLTEIKSADKIFVYKISDQQSQSVSVSGQVIMPGNYSLSNMNTIRDLLDSAKGLTEQAFDQYATLYRNQPHKPQEIITVGIKNNEFELNIDKQLKENDSLVIHDKKYFYPNSYVHIIGSVNKPGQYVFFPGMSIQNLINKAQGFTDSDSNKKITIKSKEEFSDDFIVSKVFEKISIDEFSKYPLSPFDQIIVSSDYSNRPIRINISGEVKFPGDYVQSKSSNKIIDILYEAGGLTKFASPNSIYIKRSSTEIDSTLSINEINIKKNDYIYIPVKDLNNQYYFKMNDQLVVDRYNDDIILTGEVFKESVFKFNTSRLKDYFSFSSLSDKGSKSKILVVYPNKEVKSTKRILFFKFYPKIIPGSQIIVGSKAEREKLSTQELIGISSGLSTVLIIISSLITP